MFLKNLNLNYHKMISEFQQNICIVTRFFEKGNVSYLFRNIQFSNNLS